MQHWPADILALNVGSSSIKAAIFSGSRTVWRGQAERLQRPAAIQRALETLLARAGRHGPPDLVVHRIVHGGGVFHGPTRLTETRLRQMMKFTPMAPLHMPLNILGVRAVRRRWPKVPQWGVFDTSLYDHLPARVRLYAIPSALSRRLKIRKYGFHGISHAWAMSQACRRIRRPLRRTNAVTLHLGSGDSVTRWRAGRVEDTSMGFTPLEGLSMATRSGDIDPMIPVYLQEHAGLSAAEVGDILQRRSGFFGLTGLRDVRDVLAAAGHPVPGAPRRNWTREQRHHAALALEMFFYDVQRYLASYIGLLPRCDVIVFTGAAGQNPWIRSRVIRDVPVARDVPVVVVPTNEEFAIAEQVRTMVN